MSIQYQLQKPEKQQVHHLVGIERSSAPVPQATRCGFQQNSTEKANATYPSNNVVIILKGDGTLTWRDHKLGPIRAFNPVYFSSQRMNHRPTAPINNGINYTCAMEIP